MTQRFYPRIIRRSRKICGLFFSLAKVGRIIYKNKEGNMNIRYFKLIPLFLLLFEFSLGYAQEKVTIVAPTSEAADGLDLKAVSELFKDSKNLEEFEKALNDPELGVNNLDLDENGEVDFIRVVEEVADDIHVIILQVPLGENEFQDVATIEIEKTGSEEYNMQIHGNEIIYGPDYYVVPAYVYIHRWPVILWIYRPVYRPYRSGFYHGYYPRWWKPYRPVPIKVYRTRAVKLTNKKTYIHTRRVKSIKKVNYTPRKSTLVKRKVTVKKPDKKAVRKDIRKTTRAAEKQKAPEKKAPRSQPKRNIE
jgi:hypothetical protein